MKSGVKQMDNNSRRPRALRALTGSLPVRSKRPVKPERDPGSGVRLSDGPVPFCGRLPLLDGMVASMGC
jgi:hypothetical protein